MDTDHPKAPLESQTHVVEYKEKVCSNRPITDVLGAQNSTCITLEGTQTGFRAREILKVQSTESYHYRQWYQVGYWHVPTVRILPFPASPHFSQEGSYQRHAQSIHLYGIIFG